MELDLIYGIRFIEFSIYRESTVFMNFIFTSML